MPMCVIVCGDRNWIDPAPIAARLKSLPPRSLIIHGAARGVDSIGGRVAIELGLFYVRAIPANWKKYGRAAGPIRNREMLDMKPDLVLAFHSDIASSKGTKDCVTEAKRRGIPVEVITG